MSPREFWSMNHPVHVWIYMSGFMVWIFILGTAIYFVLVGAVFTLRRLITEWLREEPEQLRFPARGL